MGRPCGRVVGTTRHAVMASHQAPCAPPGTLETLRQCLDQIITEASTDLDVLAAARNAELDARERELALAAEEICPPVLDIGISLGIERERQRVMALIERQLDHLNPGVTVIVLEALRRQVLEVET